MKEKKDNVKCKEWERRRREKLNEAFKILSQLLPNHDPAKNLPKIDILERSTEFVKDLRLSNSRLLNQQAKTDEKCKLITELQDEVNKLILRVKQLTILLKQASIPIPIGPSIKPLGKKRHKWSDKFTPENVENSTTLSSIQNNNAKGTGSTQSSGDGTTTNVATIPLKEPNVSSGATEKEAPPVISGITLVPQPQPLGPSMSLTSELPKTTTTLQLPMQTFILTSCPVTPVINQPPTQVITRIALGPTRILPKPPDGISPILQKIAILPIRKPLPPKEKKRRRRRKKVTTAIVSVEAEVQTTTRIEDEVAGDPLPKILSSSNENNENKNDGPEIIQIDDNKSSKQPSKSEKTLRENSNLKSKDLEIEISTVVEQINNDVTAKSDNSITQSVKNDLKIDEQDTLSKPALLTKTSSEATEKERKNDPIMEVEFGIAEEIEVSTERDITAENIALVKTLLGSSTSDSDNQTIQLHAIEPEEMEIDSTIREHSKTEISNNVEQVDSENGSSVLKEHKDPVPATSIKETESEKLITEDSKLKVVSEMIVEQPMMQEETAESQNHAKLLDISESEANNFVPSNNIDLVASLNQDTNGSISDTVSGDKISECIARSIDLIDAPDGELMELAENWGETCHSPKSPISPTQMFLNMFPLLPRESIVAVSEGSQQGTCQTKSSGFHYSSHRSFFIDSMLPEDNTGSSTANIPISNNSSNNESHNTVSGSSNNQNQTGTIETSDFVQASVAVPRLTEMHVPSSANLNASISSKETVPTSISNCSTSRNKNIGTKTAESTRQNNVQSTSKIITNSKDLHIFSEPLDFGTFPPISIAQVPFSEDIFRDTSRIRNAPECQSSTGLSANVGHVSNASNQSGYSQLDFSNHFQNIHHQRQSHVEFGRYDNLLSAPVNQQHQQYPFQHSTSTTLDNSFNQHQHNVESLHRDSNNTGSNPNIPQGQINRNTFSYTVDNNLRHQPYNETNVVMKQNPTQSNSVAQKVQLFRPQVGDSHQTQPVYHNLQQQSAATPKASTASCKNSNSQRSSDVTKRLESQESSAREQAPNRSSQSHHHSIQNSVVPNLQKQTYFPQIPIISTQSNSQVQRNNLQIDKQQPHSVAQPRSCQKKSNSTSVPGNTNVFTKTHNKETNSASTSSTKRSNTACQSRRNQDSNNKSVDLLNIPPPQKQASHLGQLPQRGTEPTNAPAASYAQSLAPFPDFSHSMNFNQQYDSYCNINNYNASVNPQPQHQIQLPHQSQQQRHNPLQQQTKSSVKSSTPFYLQDVPTHCDTFNFLSNPVTNLQHQHQHTSNQSTYNNINANSKPQYNSAIHISSSTNSSNVTSANPNNNVSHTQYFPSSQPQLSQTVNPLSIVNPLSSTYQQQGSYPHRQSSTSNSSSRNIQQQQPPHTNSLHTNVAENPNPLLYNSNQHQNINPQQTKSKPPTSASLSNYANQVASNITINPSNTNPSSTSSTTSRPVNWMTDSYKRNTGTAGTGTTTTVANPFSVSKLVGNTSAQTSNNNNITNTSIGNSNNNRSNNNCTNNVNTSYCAEALIRKNPNVSNSTNTTTTNNANIVNPNTTWNNLNFSSTSSSHHHPHHSQPTSSTSQANNNQQCNPNPYHSSNSSNEQFNFTGYNTTNFQQHSHHYTPPTNPTNPAGHANSNSFSQFSSVIPNTNPNQQQQVVQQGQHQQYHFSQPSHNTHLHPQNQNHHNHGTTSSVSNFNLSSIFPEINDKRHNSTGSNNNNHSSGGTNNSSNNNCGYYPQQTRHGNK